MPSPSISERRGFRGAALLGLAGLGIAALLSPGAQATAPAPAVPSVVAVDGDDVVDDLGLDDLDARSGSVRPSTAARSQVAALGARVTWNQFGTPASLIAPRGFLATGLSDNAVRAARSFVSANKALFRLSAAGVRNLEVVNNSRLEDSPGHVVLFRQRFGSLEAAQDGMITVGVVQGKVAYVSSSAVGDGNAPAAAQIKPVAAWRTAAASVDRATAAAGISDVRTERGWTTFTARGLDQEQKVRLVALPTPRDGVRPAFETIVYGAGVADPHAYTVFVDAVSGDVLLRINRTSDAGTGSSAQAGVQPSLAPTAPTAGEFSGSYTPTECGPMHPFDVPDGTQSISLAASTVVPNDIILNLYDPDDDEEPVAVSDIPFGPNPELIQYSPGGQLPAGEWNAEVCPFDENQTPPLNYQGVYATSEQSLEAFPFPRWKYFTANPPMSGADTDTRIVGCFSRADGQTANQPLPPGCDREEGNTAARAPWDFDTRTNTPTFTTRGNAALDSEAWFNFRGPGLTGRMPVSPERNYDFEWTDQWRNNPCSPLNFGPGGVEAPTAGSNDIDAATTSLFVNHNRMHDWSYFLGFTENNFNMQFNNFGSTPPSEENDPELGQAQAGAIQGGFPSFTGRDNANQTTLNDGIPGITNMYLWQPLPGAFYADCTDGDFDQSVIGHEYTHAISNRMVGGPDAGLSSSADGMARSMGESYSDFTAVEYLMEYDYVPTDDENPFSVGAYVTGNEEAGIRNYGMNNSPLNFSDVQGYDGSGVGSPHDDGEIWSAVNYDIRQAMIAKYNGRFPAGNDALQERCADGVLPADRCPGNRRWMQIVFDAYLMMPPSVSMLGSRDAYLGADLMRFGGANQRLLWDNFARRGFGIDASDTSTDDPQPIPNFESPLVGNEATTTFRFVDEDGNAIDDAQVYVGDFEGRVTPIADTDPTTPLGAQHQFVPGTYDFVVQAPGRGLTRLTRTFEANDRRGTRFLLNTNVASLSNGATITGDGANLVNLIDDTEATNYVSGAPGSGLEGDTTPATAEKVPGRQVTVDLAGRVQKVDTVNVSALLRSGAECREGEEGCDPQDLSQSRFSALRQFAIETCRTSATNDCTARSSETAAGDGFARIFTSGAKAFPGSQPRPLSSQLIFREFDVPDRRATHVRMVVLDNQCTGNREYHGDQDEDPLVVSDCRTQGVPDEAVFAPQDGTVRAAELQVFSAGGEGGGGSGTPKDPFVTFTKTGPATADQGERITYTLDYANLGPAPSSDARITDKLPAGVSFVSATGPDSYNASTRTVRWDIGTVPVLDDGTVKLTVRVAPGVETGSVLTNTAEFSAPLTIATPAVFATLVL